MKIKDILSKVIKGEALTDAEKQFLTAYDEDKAVNETRTELEKKLKAAEDKAKELEAEAGKAKGADATVQALQKKVDDLLKKNADVEAKEKSRSRMDAIKAKASEKGVSPLDGFSEKTFEALLDRAIGEVDVSNATALDAAIEAFKTENAVLIKAQSGTTTAVKGNPNPAPSAGPNPFKKDSFNLTKQIELATANPTEAKRLATEAGVTID